MYSESVEEVLGVWWADHSFQAGYLGPSGPADLCNHPNVHARERPWWKREHRRRRYPPSAPEGIWNTGSQIDFCGAEAADGNFDSHRSPLRMHCIQPIPISDAVHFSWV